MTFVVVILGALLSADITRWFSWYYYQQAGNELREEARKSHAALTAVVYLLEYPDADVTVQRDPAPSGSMGIKTIRVRIALAVGRVFFAGQIRRVTQATEPSLDG